MIEVSQVKKSYLQGIHQLEILKDINFKIEGPSTVGLLGKSGSGKSTLLSLLAGLMRPDEGKVIIDGKDLSLMNDSGRNRLRSENIGIVFQQFHLVSSLNALENVLLSLEISGQKNSMEKAKGLLQKVGLSDRMEHLPSQLSGGEKQRVALARALGNKGKILLADEPSGNLDQETGKSVMDTLFNLVHEEKKIMILVTHDQDLARQCTKRMNLEGGRLHDL